jgi:hypothetical protein
MILDRPALQNRLFFTKSFVVPRGGLAQSKKINDLRVRGHRNRPTRSLDFLPRVSNRKTAVPQTGRVYVAFFGRAIVRARWCTIFRGARGTGIQHSPGALVQSSEFARNAAYMCVPKTSSV